MNTPDILAQLACTCSIIGK